MIPILRQLLRAFRVLLEQVVRLGEPHQTLNQSLVVRDKRLHACGERLDSERG